MRYVSTRSDDQAVWARLRRLHVLLDRERIMLNHKKLRRIYALERLYVRCRVGRKRALGRRARIVLPSGPNQHWFLDFVSDALTDSRRFRILCIFNDYIKECLCLTADTALP